MSAVTPIPGWLSGLASARNPAAIPADKALMITFLLILFPSCDLNRELTSPFRIVIIATRHISSPFHAAASLRDAFPLPTNTLLYFPLADQRPAYLWPVQAQHRYGAASLLFANHRLDFSFPVVALPLLSIASQCIACAVLRFRFRAIAHLCYLGPCKILHCLRFFCRDVAALFFCFCQTMPSRAIASPHISSLYQLRCLSALCYRFADRCVVLLQHDVSMPFLLLAIPITTLLAHFHSFLLVSKAFQFFWRATLCSSSALPVFALRRHRSPLQCIALLFFCDSWIRCASPSQSIAEQCFSSAERNYSFSKQFPSILMLFSAFPCFCNLTLRHAVAIQCFSLPHRCHYSSGST